MHTENLFCEIFVVASPNQIINQGGLILCATIGSVCEIFEVNWVLFSICGLISQGDEAAELDGRGRFKPSSAEIYFV